jgi:sulfide dehydrogenase cytochrome subunit
MLPSEFDQSIVKGILMRVSPSRLLHAAVGIAACLTLAAQAQTPPNGRLLASNCFQCHGTNGKGPGFDKLAGKSATEIYKELTEFRSGKEGDNIMARHAMGFTDAQMRSLAAWLSTQR